MIDCVLVFAVDVGQLLKEIGEVGVGVEAVFLGGLDDAVDGGAGFGASGCVGEEPVFASR